MAVDVSYNILLKPVFLDSSSDYLERDGSTITTSSDYLERNGNTLDLRNVFKNRLVRINVESFNVSIKL